MTTEGSLQKNMRSIRASRPKLIHALYAGGMKSQTELAKKIAVDEALNTIPKNLVNKVFTGKPVDMLSLERVATGLGVEAHKVILTSDEVEDADLNEDKLVENQDHQEVPAKARHSRLIPILSVFIAGAITASVVTFFLLSYRPLATENKPPEDAYTSVTFAFAEGTPLRGYGIFNGVLVTLDSLHTEPFGYSIRDLLDTETAKIELVFDEPIDYFRLDVSYVLPPDEFLTNFNIGLPTRTTGSMEIIDGVVTSNIPGDNGAGALIWEGFSMTNIYFEIQNLPESTVMPALAIDSFGFRLEGDSTR